MTIVYELDVSAPLLVGDGVGAGGPFDRLTVMENDLPYIPASSIRGCIKATIARLISDDRGRWDRLRTLHTEKYPFCSATSEWPCPLCRIFGAPGGIQRGFTFSGAYYSRDARDYVEQVFRSSQAMNVHIERRVRNKIDTRLRRAREDHLFVDGAAVYMSNLCGAIYESPLHAAYPKEIITLDVSLLLLGLRLTTRLGASRNRGYGRINFILKEPSNWHDQIRSFTDEWQNAIEGGSGDVDLSGNG